MRPFLLCAALAVSVFGDESVLDIVKRSLDLDNRNSQHAKDYTYQARAVSREMDGQGNVKSSHSRTFDVLPLYGRPYRRLIQKDDKPLTPAEQEKQEERWKNALERRRKQTEDENSKEHRAYEKHRAEDRKFTREIPEAYNFKLVGEETVSGKPAWVIQAEPKPGYQPKDPQAKMLTKLRGKLWIDKAEYQWVKIEAETTDTISLGWFIARISRGSFLRFEQRRVNDEVWLPSHVEVGVDARLALLKKLRGGVETTYTNYRKFQTDSRVVSTEADARP
jgi:hypothetical protein